MKIGNLGQSLGYLKVPSWKLIIKKPQLPVEFFPFNCSNRGGNMVLDHLKELLLGLIN